VSACFEGDDLRGEHGRLTSLTLNRFFDLRTFLLGIAIKVTLAGWLAASGVQ
jgi:hypothetical protein